MNIRKHTFPQEPATGLVGRTAASSGGQSVVSVAEDGQVVYRGVGLGITFTALFNMRVYGGMTYGDILDREYERAVSERREERLRNLLD